jgi:uroporphyrinogen decarboxylase
MNRKENILRAIRFENPDFIPMQYHINHACWNYYDHSTLFDLMEAHPLLFPEVERPKDKYIPDYLVNAIADVPYTDPWGCVWKTTEDGITGTVIQHPLNSWDDFDQYSAPDTEKTDGTYNIDWEQLSKTTSQIKKERKIIWGGLPHGHTFLRLQDIRGYNNLVADMFKNHPNLDKLIKMIETFNLGYLRKYLNLNPDIVTIPEDLGMQVGPMLMPKHFQKYIKPSYQHLIDLVRKNDCLVHMHSDGDIRTLISDIIDCGIDIINLQDLTNGIDWLQSSLKGKVCIDLDIDRQTITPFKTPKEIDDLILEEIKKLGSKEGGLMMIYGLYPGVPIENAKAIMDAMEKYATYYSG